MKLALTIFNKIEKVTNFLKLSWQQSVVPQSQHMLVCFPAHVSASTEHAPAMLRVISICTVDHKLLEGRDWAPFLSFWRWLHCCTLNERELHNEFVKQNLVATARVLFRLDLGCCCVRTTVIGYDDYLQFFRSLFPHRPICSHGIPNIVRPFIFLMLASKGRFAARLCQCSHV